ncbi:threonine--tRNA ligase [Candidatus Dojkabacteria bacterium]|uniref:Threonine--tRNA ligase n=1 Tax=Candidatus Dojkabacteria bacterium TaxID=2099670 RepID=A0A955I1U4_9BACT|nr:threonine--tRNA ligase [Candidatus Dojkabacteria bacterium]MCB9790725.1 threonine--tRNA ligase [Candidatus Nomurabacteria bacterium]
MSNQNNKNIDVPQIEKMRHSAAHVLAQAVLSLYPEAKLGIGPAIEDGFYYDFEFPTQVSDDVLQKIEKEMKKIIKRDLSLKQTFKDRKGVVERYKALGQEYKLDLLNNIEGDEISFYVTGDDEFIDMCRGPHVSSTKEIGAIKLLRIAGAYWKGDEKNKMLTRIYGTAFESKKDLDEYLERIEEAKKRDHRKIGKELGLFVFSETVGKGLPLWTPKGAAIRRELERFIVDLEIARGYQHVSTPEIARLQLYEKSGHYPYYKDSMYAPIEDEDEKFMLRPMTCPHHFELYLSEPRSYRDLPMRIAELAKLFRYEQSGELSGLIRVRSFCLSDAHIVCANAEQAKSEAAGVIDLIQEITEVFGLKMGENYRFKLSLGDRKDEKKFYKNDNAWDEAEEALREVLKNKECEYYEEEGDAAFYGPKIDIQMRNVLGKEETAFTIQYDFVMPERFDLNYVDQDGELKKAIVIHRSAIGCLERIIAFLIEYYAGAFPTWLSPIQVRVIPISEKHLEYAQEIKQELWDKQVRVELDDRNERLQYKIRDAEVNKIPYTLVVGDKEIETSTVSVRVRGKKDQGLHKKDTFLKHLLKEIKEKDISPSLGA